MNNVYCIFYFVSSKNIYEKYNLLFSQGTFSPGKNVPYKLGTISPAFSRDCVGSALYYKVVVWDGKNCNRPV